MKRTALFAFLFTFSAPILAVYQVGETPKNYCWKDMNDQSVCLDDPSIQSQIRVLMYNAGWCGPCNSEFQDLVKETNQFKNKAVVFLSLSASGWSQAAPPDKKFLKEWSTQHKLDQAEAHVLVLGSARDAGKDFFEDVYIPNIAILDGNGTITYKGINPGLGVVTSEVKKVLPMPCVGSDQSGTSSPKECPVRAD